MRKYKIDKEKQRKKTEKGRQGRVYRADKEGDRKKKTRKD